MNDVQQFLADFARLPGMARSIMTWINDNGREFEAAKWRPRVYDSRGCRKPKGCFENVFKLVDRNPDLVYCEGYAQHSILPVHHAWAFDPETKLVVDPTPVWANGESIYFGVPFRFDYVIRRTYKMKSYWGAIELADPDELANAIYKEYSV